MSRPAFARIHLANLRHNYRLLVKQAGSAKVMAIVKADAYGHGLPLVAPALVAEGCNSFGVTDAREGAELRSMANEAEIALLSGIFDAEDAELARQHRLVPVLIDTEQVQRLASAGFTGDVWIKLDSGMTRLGAEPATTLLDACREAGFGIAGLLTHLACADEPGHPQNMAQIEAFHRCRRQLGEDLPASLLNSAGMISLAEHAADVVRPGIALYGAEPIPAMPLGLKPVMQFAGRIMQLREQPAGRSISYGASFTTSRPTRIATVSLGYADGLPRHLSNRGYAIFEGQKLPIAGRVCMDYTMLDVGDAGVAVGDDVEFWGVALPANEVAELAGTIAYTLFTGIGRRVQRMAG